MRYLLFFLLLPLSAFCQPFTSQEISQWKQQASRVTIIRDKWSIPHVYAKTDADVVFGLLYAQCEDDFERVEENYITALGRTAEVKGETFLYEDLRMRMYSDTIKVAALYEKSPANMKKLMDAFANGVNYYLYTHPEVKPKLLHRFQPWLPLLFSEGSIGGDITRISVDDIRAFYTQSKSSDTDGASLKVLPEPKGSNGFAIAPKLSASGNPLLLINPHTSFYFRSEVHMNSEEGLNAYGAVTWGQFFIYQGFNDKCGWMHTSTYADVADEYKETITKKNDSLFYQYDGKLRLVTKEKIELKYKNGNGIEKKQFTIYRTHHGPVIAEKQGKWISIRMMHDPLNALTQSYMRTKATDYKSFGQWMELKTNSSNNTVFADSKGSIAYWHGNFMPKRDTKFDWTLPVDGNDPATEWKGLHDTKDLVQLLNPANGWIQNCNATPFTAADVYSPKKENYPVYMAPDGQNFRGINAARVLKKGSAYTLDKLITAAYNPKLTAFEKLLPSLMEAHRAATSTELKAKLAEPLKVLQAWDMNCGIASVGQTLAIQWGKKVQAMTLARIPERTSEQRTDIVGLVDNMITKTTAEEKVKALADAIDELTTDFGTWNISWGEINRFQRLTGKIDETFDDAKPSLPVAYTSSFWGTLPAFGSRAYTGTKKFYGNVGNSFVAVVEFGKKVRAKSIVTGGESSTPSSPHFTDQANMYTKGEFKDVLFYKEDVRRSAEKTYHPGND